MSDIEKEPFYTPAYITESLFRGWRLWRSETSERLSVAGSDWYRRDSACQWYLNEAYHAWKKTLIEEEMAKKRESWKESTKEEEEGKKALLEEGTCGTCGVWRKAEEIHRRSKWNVSNRKKLWKSIWRNEGSEAERKLKRLTPSQRNENEIPLCLSREAREMTADWYLEERQRPAKSHSSQCDCREGESSTTIREGLLSNGLWSRPLTCLLSLMTIVVASWEAKHEEESNL